MRNCFVPACDSLCKDKDRRMMFLPPKVSLCFGWLRSFAFNNIKI